MHHQYVQVLAILAYLPMRKLVPSSLRTSSWNRVFFFFFGLNFTGLVLLREVKGVYHVSRSTFDWLHYGNGNGCKYRRRRRKREEKEGGREGGGWWGIDVFLLFRPLLNDLCYHPSSPRMVAFLLVKERFTTYKEKAFGGSRLTVL